MNKIHDAWHDATQSSFTTLLAIRGTNFRTGLSLSLINPTGPEGGHHGGHLHLFHHVFHSLVHGWLCAERGACGPASNFPSTCSDHRIRKYQSIITLFKSLPRKYAHLRIELGLEVDIEVHHHRAS